MNSQRSLCLALALSAAATTAAPAASSGSCNYTFTEHANPLAGGQFYGRTIALSEDVLAATSTLSPTGSAVTVHERDFGGPGNWGLAKTLIPTGGAGTSFGAAVGVSGDTIVVGSPSEQLLGAYKGAVYVFERDRGGPGNWGLTQKIFGPNDPPGDFGVAVSIDGDRIAVATSQPQPGQVTLLGRDIGGVDNWGVEDVVRAPSAFASRFGDSLSLSGDTLAVGDREDSELGSFAGAVTILEPVGGDWTVTARVLPPNGLAGQAFGGSVSLEGNTAVAGAYLADPGGVNNIGAVWILDRDQGGSNAWGSVAMKTPSIGGPSSRFGLTTAISGQLVAVGAPTHSPVGCTNQGLAFVYARDLSGLNAWDEVTPVLSPAACGDRFSDGIALSGTMLAVGAPNADSVVGNSGSVFFYENVIAGKPAPYCTAGTTGNGCRAAISGLGYPSASLPTGFFLVASNVEGARQGLFFFGTSGRKATAWGGGTSFRCVEPPVRRTPAQTSGGTSGQCDGTLTLDFNTWMAAHPGLAPTAGTRVYAQAWFRDPPSPMTTSFSNGLDFIVCP